MMLEAFFAMLKSFFMMLKLFFAYHYAARTHNLHFSTHSISFPLLLSFLPFQSAGVLKIDIAFFPRCSLSLRSSLICTFFFLNTFCLFLRLFLSSSFSSPLHPVCRRPQD